MKHIDATHTAPRVINPHDADYLCRESGRGFFIGLIVGVIIMLPAIILVGILIWRWMR